MDDGLLTYRNREGNVEIDPVFAARAFYAAHHDEYDFLVLCTNFPTQLGSSNFLAYHLAVANDVTGLGYAGNDGPGAPVPSPHPYRAGGSHGGEIEILEPTRNPAATRRSAACGSRRTRRRKRSGR